MTLLLEHMWESNIWFWNAQNIYYVLAATKWESSILIWPPQNSACENVVYVCMLEIYYCQDVYIDFTMFPYSCFPHHSYGFHYVSFFMFPSFIIYLVQYIGLKVRYGLLTTLHSFPHYFSWNDGLSQFYAKLKRVSWSNVITTYPKGSWERSKALAAISAISLRCGTPVEKSMHRCNTQQPWRCVAISTQWDVTASKMNCIPPNVDLKKFKTH